MGKYIILNLLVRISGTNVTVTELFKKQIDHAQFSILCNDSIMN